MPNRVLTVYRWATLGGVERMLLNRGRALARVGLPGFDILFLHDAGGADQFRAEISAAGLNDVLRVISNYSLNHYDLVLSIDTPEVINLVDLSQPLGFECHTAYERNQKYLEAVGRRAVVVGVPSPVFLDEIRRQFGDFDGRLRLVRNFVAKPDAIVATRLPQWTKRPVLHLGRVDTLKNVTELLDGAKIYREVFGDDLMIVLVGKVSSEIDARLEIQSRDLGGRVMVLAPIAFQKTWDLLAGIKARGGILTSCSRGESFGLAAAEAISIGLPVLLSDIPPHRELVGLHAEHLYRLGDARDWADRMRVLLSTAPKHLSIPQEFSEAAFIADWTALLQAARAQHRAPLMA